MTEEEAKKILEDKHDAVVKSVTKEWKDNKKLHNKVNVSLKELQSPQVSALIMYLIKTGVIR